MKNQQSITSVKIMYDNGKPYTIKYPEKHNIWGFFNGQDLPELLTYRKPSRVKQFTTEVFTVPTKDMASIEVKTADGVVMLKPFHSCATFRVAMGKKSK